MATTVRQTWKLTHISHRQLTVAVRLVEFIAEGCFQYFLLSLLSLFRFVTHICIEITNLSIICAKSVFKDHGSKIPRVPPPPVLPWQRSRTSPRSRSPCRRSPAWADGKAAGPTYWPGERLELVCRGSGSPEERRRTVKHLEGAITSLLRELSSPPCSFHELTPHATRLLS